MEFASLAKHVSVMKIKFFLFCIHFFVFYHSSAQPVKFNDFYSLACHNCYQPDIAPDIQDVLRYTTTIELDFWDSEIGSGVLTDILHGHRLDQNWYVKHDPQTRGNLNCCGGTLKDCFLKINDWANKNPEHQVITVFLDKKENWSGDQETRKPEDLDNLILSVFDRNKIFTPATLRKDFVNLKASVANEGWPLLDSLKGKIIFVLTDARLFSQRNKALNDYLKSRKNNSICFVAPEIENSAEISDPSGIDQQNSSEVVFYNLKFEQRGRVAGIASINCLVRVYGSPEVIDTVDLLKSMRVNFIAMFNYKLGN